MKKRRAKLSTLYVITGLLSVVLAAVVYADCLIGDIYLAQKKNAALSLGATPIPVLDSTPTPVPTPTPTAPPQPTRTPLAGDIAGVRFPDYDTGENADYSYQTDELKIAVHKVEDLGVTYYVADIWMRNISCFQTAFSSGKYKGKRQDAEKISKDNNAVLAVNGDFLGGLVIRNGVLYKKAVKRFIEEEEEPDTTPGEIPTVYDPFALPTPTPTPTPKPKSAQRPERATCVLYADGRMITEEYQTFRSVKAMERGAWQGWQFGPTLVRGGVAAEDVKKQGRNPRTMLGYYEPGHYCIVVIDGRQKGYSIGMNFYEMMELAKSLGLTEAYNLDGGGSAIMTFNGEIINRPSGGNNGRSLPDMVVIGEYVTPDKLFSPTPAPTPISEEEQPQ
ncbi:MAG: phosphodiester glycosidase family protein [Eubacteriales bacterium]|nr:phosphodiester glycosidase family protein [Eubacteriales bacterium]